MKKFPILKKDMDADLLNNVSGNELSEIIQEYNNQFINLSDEAQDYELRNDLADIAHYYWKSLNKWDDLRDIIDQEEEAEAEANWERSQNRY